MVDRKIFRIFAPMKQKIYILLLLICVLPLSEEVGAQEVILTITNPGHNQRQEVAEASLQTICELPS